MLTKSLVLIIWPDDGRLLARDTLSASETPSLSLVDPQYRQLGGGRAKINSKDCLVLSMNSPSSGWKLPTRRASLSLRRLIRATRAQLRPLGMQTWEMNRSAF